MMRWVRRTITVAAVVAVVAVVARRWARRSIPRPAAAPQWPPFDTVDAVTSVDVPVGDVVATPWVAPVEGGCTAAHPVKANDTSGIYHVPGGRFYDRTKAERCYVDAASAEADGYRAAKA